VLEAEKDLRNGIWGEMKAQALALSARGSDGVRLARRVERQL
jgi:hypothetical protein